MNPHCVGIGLHLAQVVAAVAMEGFKNPNNDRMMAEKMGKALIISITNRFFCLDIEQSAAKGAPKESMERKIEPDNCISFGPNKMAKSRLISTDNP